MFKPFLMICLLLASPLCVVQAASSDLWVSNETVLTSASSGNQLYIGGEFTYVGPRTGSGVIIDTDGGVITGTPVIGDAIYAVIDDGVGGWFIGGDFDAINGVAHSNIAHIFPNNTLDNDWLPAVDGAVRSLVLSGSILTIAGDFTNVDGASRNHLAALDTTASIAGAYVTIWAPDIDAAISSMIFAGTTLYVGGDFTNVDGAPRNHLAALDSTANTAGSYVMAFDPDVDAAVSAMVVSGTSLIIGGEFTNVGATIRHHLAAIDSTTGIATAWNPDVAVGATVTVKAMALSGTTVYVGGDFLNIDGVSRHNIAALDTTAATVGAYATAWQPNVDGVVNSLVLDGGRLYVGGDFTHIDSISRSRLAAFLITDGALVGDWDPKAGRSVMALASATVSGRVYVGGQFLSAGGVNRDYVAALDLSSGQALGWNPDANDVVRAFLLSDDASLLYMGGDFTTLGGQFRTRLAAVSTTTGLVNNWRPTANDSVHSMTASIGRFTLYAGGRFTELSGLTRFGIAELRLSDGALTSWKPAIGHAINAPLVNGVVFETVVNQGTIYLAGDFETVGNISHQGIVAVDVFSGEVRTWDPLSNGIVNAVAVNETGTSLYVGGDFSDIGGSARSGLAKLDTATSFADAWAPQPDGDVLALWLSDASATLYVGGAFTMISAESHGYLAALDVFTASPRPTWTHQTDNLVRDIKPITSLDALLIVGDYLRFDGDLRGGLAYVAEIPTETDAPVTTASLPAGSYNSETNTNITLNCDDGGGSGCEAIYFTTDGSLPIQDVENLYETPLSFSKNTRLQFFAVDKVGNVEAVQLIDYIIEVLSPLTTASPGTRAYSTETLRVSLSCSDGEGSGCLVTYYTLDGSTPTTSSPQYNSPILIRGKRTLKFFSIDNVGNVEGTQREGYVSHYGGAGLMMYGLMGLLLLWLVRHFRKGDSKMMSGRSQ